MLKLKHISPFQRCLKHLLPSNLSQYTTLTDPLLPTRPSSRKKKVSSLLAGQPETQSKLASNAETEEQRRKNFETMLSQIKEMRKTRNAPVDLMGYKSLYDEAASKDIQNYQSLVALLLSVQNRDQITAAVMQRFIKRGLTPGIVSKMSEEEIQKEIKGVNYDRKKAGHIKQATTLIIEKYDGKVPDSLDELLKFPGVGYKIAILYLNNSEKSVGIGVDTHVHRISNRLGWVNTKVPDQTRVALEAFIPQEHWNDLNTWLVGFGQQTCLSVRPKCSMCLLVSSCPSAKKEN